MLHDNLAGYWTVLNARELPADPGNAESTQFEAGSGLAAGR